MEMSLFQEVIDTCCLARYIHDQFALTHLIESDKGIWYFYNGTQWVDDHTASKLLSRIIEEIAPQFADFQVIVDSHDRK
jgi:hypothetical protein